MTNPSPTIIPPFVAQEIGLMHLQLAAARQRITELENQLAAPDENMTDLLDVDDNHYADKTLSRT